MPPDPLSAALGGAIVKGASKILTFRPQDIGVCNTRVERFGWLPWHPKVLIHPMADGTHEQRWVGRPPKRRRRRSQTILRRVGLFLLGVATAVVVLIAALLMGVLHL